MNLVEHFNYLVKSKNILIYGSNKLENLEDLFKMFRNKYYQEDTPYALDGLTSTIINYDIDCVILSELTSFTGIYKKMQNLIDEKNLDVIFCFNMENPNSLDENLINLCDKVISSNVSKELFQKKVINMLSSFVYLNSENMGSDLISANNKNERYKDEFDLKIINYCSELTLLVNQLDNGDISNKVIKKLHKNIKEINGILDEYIILSEKIVKVIKELEIYLENFDLSSLDISAVDGFEHLARLAEDIRVFLNKYFITKQIDDLYIVEDSLENSFEFVKRSFKGDKSEDDGSLLEFF